MEIKWECVYVYDDLETLSRKGTGFPLYIFALVCHFHFVVYFERTFT